MEIPKGDKTREIRPNGFFSFDREKNVKRTDICVFLGVNEHLYFVCTRPEVHKGCTTSSDSVLFYVTKRSRRSVWLCCELLPFQLTQGNRRMHVMEIIQMNRSSRDNAQFLLARYTKTSRTLLFIMAHPIFSWYLIGSSYDTRYYLDDISKRKNAFCVFCMRGT